MEISATRSRERRPTDLSQALNLLLKAFNLLSGRSGGRGAVGDWRGSDPSEKLLLRQQKRNHQFVLLLREFLPDGTIFLDGRHVGELSGFGRVLAIRFVNLVVVENDSIGNERR